MPQATRDDIPSLVKIAILKTNGSAHPDPTRLPADTQMSAFHFSFFLYSQLTVRFDQISDLFNQNTDISETAVEHCKTVQDCINLVLAQSN